MESSKRNSLQVFIGHRRKVATISLSLGSETDISLNYERSWVESGFPISPHLPLDGSFSHREVRNFLQNLLPEGKGLDEITTFTIVSKNNVFGLLRIIGAETSGALSFRRGSESATETTFREITEQELAKKLTRVKEMGEPITVWDGKTRLSVAGVQDKLNLLELDGRIGFGEGELCSNKIFKFETGKVPFIAVNELFTMLLADAAGLDVPDVELRSYGGVRTFVIPRFDRRVLPEKNLVQRRHIIDGCQASNLPPSYKYERQHGDEGDGVYIRDGVSFPKLFAIETVNHEAYQAQLIRWMTFNILVRNYDGHGKNISFFVSKQGLELTPFYDLVNVEAIIREIENLQDGNSSIQGARISRNFAMSIGDFSSGSAGNFNVPITAYMLADFAEGFGISLQRMQLLMSQMIQSVLNGIDQARVKASENDLQAAELKHIDLCVAIIREAADDLAQEVQQLPEMKRWL